VAIFATAGTGRRGPEDLSDIPMPASCGGAASISRDDRRMPATFEEAGVDSLSKTRARVT
jgi:hypothetical protein